MISLARHIELLLLEHDCVIVPGFGGFIANYNPARYNSDGDMLFLPPYRTIAFNQQLTINDGLLVQSYMTAYDASYPSACLQMEADVERMAEVLERTGEYMLEGVGVLRKLMNGIVSFTSYEAGVVTPRLYGLYSFEMLSLEQLKKDAEVQEALNVGTYTAVDVDRQDVDEDEEREREFNLVKWIGGLSHRWKEVAVSAAAAVVLFLSFVIPATTTNRTVDEMVVASAYSVAPKADTTLPVVDDGTVMEAVTEIEGKEIIGTDAMAQAEEVQQSVEQPARYAIVLASYVSETNANAFIDILAKKGFTEGRFVRNGKVSRVLYSGYATEAEAYASLGELRKQTKEFAEGWVMKISD